MNQRRSIKSRLSHWLFTRDKSIPYPQQLLPEIIHTSSLGRGIIGKSTKKKKTQKISNSLKHGSSDHVEKSKRWSRPFHRQFWAQISHLFYRRFVQSGDCYRFIFLTYWAHPWLYVWLAQGKLWGSGPWWNFKNRTAYTWSLSLSA